MTAYMRSLSLSGVAFLSACLPVFLTGCSSAGPTPPNAFPAGEPLPPIRTVFECLPKEAALVAAHRGTDSSLRLPENSISALEAMIAAGVLMAEIDIAAIRDGTPIIFHDGVWDDHVSSTGPVVATEPDAFARLRLKDMKGVITAEPVPTLADMLDRAKDRIYLEVDFKSSADMATVVQMIRDRDMTDQVILIATTDDEAEALRPFAGEFLLSLPRARKRITANARQGVWIGGRWRDGDDKAVAARHYVFGAQWQKNAAELPKAARALDLLVTDQPLRYDPVVGMRGKGAAFRACLSADEDERG
ncbi:glycerophosphodiester phosphodiesterase family protein [Algimonas porphyrae]|uniref:GP-PDE domain-containing protein n=1 Tax=Algimonas porphyrae TaxID=1128113 RepID=A0ABQ5UZ69_9PROT|nr:glycerophosphodiester phosphodiesterase family protein [Algimonas porphyrae]GLQ20561.1 hypothetical protein GCM10007854_15160 [Algimonas porphyrae]